jgi:hypothetical protein
MRIASMDEVMDGLVRARMPIGSHVARVVAFDDDLNEMLPNTGHGWPRDST